MTPEQRTKWQARADELQPGAAVTELAAIREAARMVLTSPGVSPHLDRALNNLAVATGLPLRNPLLDGPTPPEPTP